MGNATYRNRNYIIQKDPRVAEALDDVVKALNSAASQVVASPQGVTSPPADISQLTVTAADGIFDAAIKDGSSVNRGINYFLEYSPDIGFTTPTVIDLGASRNWRRFMGNLTLYWRAYSSYPTSASSSPVYFGTPTAVVGGGAAGPTPNPSSGSGTGSDDGQDGGSGFGSEPRRTGRGFEDV